MSEPLTPTVQHVLQDTTIDPSGQIKPLMRVQYMVGEHGPFSLNLAPADFTADKVKAAMQVVADQINALTGGQ